MSKDKQDDPNETADGADAQDTARDDAEQASSAGADGQPSEDSKHGNKKTEQSGETESETEADDDSGDDDVIHVAQTPTSAALLTQLEHNRADSRARGLGAGQTGSPIFHTQRLTALALIPLGIWFVVGIIRLSQGPHVAAAAWLGWPPHAVLMALFIVIGARHAVIGIRIILEDYVRDDAWRIPCLLAVQAIAVVLCVVSVAALIHLAL